MDGSNSKLWLPAGVTAQGTSGGADTYAAVTAPSGELWEIVSAVVYHDDATSRVLYWVAYDGATEFMITTTPAVVAANVQLRLPDFATPLVLGGAFVLRGYCAAETAASHVNVRAIMRKLRGAGVVSNE